jgi:hypothetical protein
MLFIIRNHSLYVIMNISIFLYRLFSDARLMRRTSLFLFLILFFLFGISQSTDQVFAQSSVQINEAQPLEHPLKVFQDRERERIYWPQELPVYVWLSSSPEPGATKHRLKNAQLKNEDGYSPAEQEKINLELSGNQFIRWVNYETKDTLMLQFQSDGDTPETQIDITAPNQYRAGNSQFYGEKLQASFTSEDTHAGVNDIYTSVNGADYSPFFGTYNFNQEKKYLVTFYSVDNVGNAEIVQRRAFTVDLSAPNSRHTITGTHTGSTLAPTAGIKLESGDELSGVKTIRYFFDEESPQTYSSELSVSGLGEGDHTLTYFATDNVTNQERERTFAFYLDETTPRTDLIVEGDQFEGNRLFVSEHTEYRLESSDNKTGVQSVFYTIDSGNEQTFNGENFTLPGEEKSYRLAFGAVDNVENREAQNTQTLVLDKTPPTSDHTFDGKSFTQRGQTWITSQTQIILSSDDELSGVENIRFSVEGERESELYETPLSFSNEGRYTIHYFGTDRVQNEEEKITVIVIADNTAPEIIKNFSSGKIGSSTTENGSVLDQYPVDTQIYLAATDASSGADGIWYRINEGDESAYATPLTFSEPGEHSVMIKSIDRVGNEIEEELRFIIVE